MEINSITGAVIHKLGDLDSIVIEQVPVPHLEDSQILVRMECAPINVSDILKAMGNYSTTQPNCILGIEGSGTVVKSGIDEYSQSLVAKRVAVTASVPRFGTFADYLVTSAFSAFPLKDHITFEQGASLVINPVTVAYMVKKIKEGNHTSVIINAAASALGKMLIRWCDLLNVATINLVRRQEQVDTLAGIGAKHIFNTSVPGWKEEAQSLTNQLGTKIGFDAIAGSATEDMLQLLTEKGVVYVYGVLSGQPAEGNPMTLAGGDKSIKGLMYGRMFKGLSIEQKLEIGNEIQDLIGDALKTDYQSEVALDDAKDALKQYAAKKTDSKYLVRVRRS
ncbi:unnamed protein product [Blepharisma stoltei]|uniref:Enoyl reductase (ER) domain-containing protein n=1 Tax=Blepharisma stoltei TaxID=1481888 RepID=A0AAU9J3R0_9CILI|nr:unnamed protein product [Blepharisma stoltei]